MEFKEMTEKIIGCAYRVYNKMGYLKSVRRVIVAHEIELVNDLVATGKPVGLVLNFGERKVDVRRKVRQWVGR